MIGLDGRPAPNVGVEKLHRLPLRHDRTQDHRHNAGTAQSDPSRAPRRGDPLTVWSRHNGMTRTIRAATQTNRRRFAAGRACRER
jgi:hypothetical protein